MAIKSGDKLGPYEIVEPIGAGGMGEVYRARDTRLDRDVAIKVLPSHLSENRQVRLRFEREARAASSLNHPHICTIYDIGKQEGIDFSLWSTSRVRPLRTAWERAPFPPRNCFVMPSR